MHYLGDDYVPYGWGRDTYTAPQGAGLYESSEEEKARVKAAAAERAAYDFEANLVSAAALVTEYIALSHFRCVKARPIVRRYAARIEVEIPGYFLAKFPNKHFLNWELVDGSLDKNNTKQRELQHEQVEYKSMPLTRRAAWENMITGEYDLELTPEQKGELPEILPEPATRARVIKPAR